MSEKDKFSSTFPRLEGVIRMPLAQWLRRYAWSFQCTQKEINVLLEALKEAGITTTKELYHADKEYVYMLCALS